MTAAVGTNKSKTPTLLSLKDLRFQDSFTKELTPDPHTPRGPAPYKGGDNGISLSTLASNSGGGVGVGGAGAASTFHNPFATSGKETNLSLGLFTFPSIQT